MASGVSTRTANRMNAGALISHGGTNACHGARVLINAPLSFDFVDSIVLAMARFLNHAHGITMPVDANRLALRHRFRAFVLAAHEHFANGGIDAIQPLAAQEKAAGDSRRQT